MAPLLFSIPKPEPGHAVRYRTTLWNKFVHVRVRIQRWADQPGFWRADLHFYQLRKPRRYTRMVATDSFPGILKMVESTITVMTK